MIFRILASFLLFVLVQFPMYLLGLVIVPIGLKRGFTGILWPWGNDDHPDNGGVFAVKNNISPYVWFALRNPVFNFGKYVCGFKSEGKAIFRLGTSSKIGDKVAEGWYYACEKHVWDIYAIKKYTLFGQTKCFRFRCGWKIMNKSSGEICSMCFVISPFHDYSGV